MYAVRFVVFCVVHYLLRYEHEGGADEHPAM